MERARPYLKVAALVTAVGLGGAFVAYRAGAFAAASPVEAQSGPPLILAPETDAQQPTPNPSQLPPAVMFGSKSAPAFTPAQPAPASPDKPSVFMAPSKSIVLFPVSPSLNQGSQPGTAPPAPNSLPAGTGPSVFPGGPKP
jgi:hypothetical protein